MEPYHVDQFCGQICEIAQPHCHLAHWHPVTDCRIAIPISEDSVIFTLYRNLVRFGTVTSQRLWH